MIQIRWLGLLVVIVGVLRSTTAAESLSPTLVIPEWAGDSCVAPTPAIRRDHMRFLLEQRDLTVRQGVRGGRFSLRGCVQCHANRDSAGIFMPVNAPGQFCQSCHEFTGVSMDCFQCHATTPD